MSYTINLPDGSVLTTILDGTVNNTASSLTLVGRNYSGYGEIIAEDLVDLLVNFAYSVAPTSPNTGQLWYDTTAKTLKVYTANSTWKNVGSCTSQASPPSSTVAGDLWWDSVDKQLYCYDGTTPYVEAGWILVGPGYSVVYGKSGAIWEQISDGTNLFDVVSVYLDGTRTAIISSSAFTPATPIPGIGSIQVGWNMSTSYIIYGTANNASYLGTQPAANYFRNNINNNGTGTLTILNNGGITLGNHQAVSMTTLSNSLSITNNINGGNISFRATTAGVTTQYLSINAVTGAVEVLADPTTVLGVATKQYVDNRFINANLWGVSTAVTAAAGTSTDQIATTAFVVSGLSGLFPYKIYQGNSHFWINDSGTGSANLVIDGSTIMTATSTGVYLENGATANVTTATRGGIESGPGVASTGYVRTAGQWWGNANHRSAKIVSTAEPIVGVNDAGTDNGDFWFQIES